MKATFEDTREGKMTEPIIGKQDDPEILVSYDPAMDELTLWDGTPASFGAHVGLGLTVFSDEDDVPHIVTLEPASELLRELLVRKEAVTDQPASQLLQSKSD